MAILPKMFGATFLFHLSKRRAVPRVLSEPSSRTARGKDETCNGELHEQLASSMSWLMYTSLLYITIFTMCFRAVCGSVGCSNCGDLTLAVSILLAAVYIGAMQYVGELSL